ncbi:hypothetical protein BKA83DRAFT_4175664 [Pisolithus microcarpus]|nr:hypothetical protein BKA83DRAFT_4175664 [Pisolithus microcarpus]
MVWIGVWVSVGMGGIAVSSGSAVVRMVGSGVGVLLLCVDMGSLEIVESVGKTVSGRLHAHQNIQGGEDDGERKKRYQYTTKDE